VVPSRLCYLRTIDGSNRAERHITTCATEDPCCGTGRMLLEASNINNHAELVGQDIDARCAKITAINLGLRGRYGWVLCGNSLSGEMKFAYRIGSFYNESPQGLRRGVIRDVPPEQTPVPILASRVRDQSQSLLATEDAPEGTGPSPMPTIIEVPQWLARLEPGLRELDSEATTIVRKPQDDVELLADSTTAARKQQELF
jgi:hypothetical protein